MHIYTSYNMFLATILILWTFQVVRKISATQVWHYYDMVGYFRGGGGAKSVAQKTDFSSFRARSALLARANFLRQPLATYKTFVSDKFSLLFLVGSIQKMGLPPPPPPIWFQDSIFFKRKERLKITFILFLERL